MPPYGLDEAAYHSEPLAVRRTATPRRVEDNEEDHEEGADSPHRVSPLRRPRRRSCLKSASWMSSSSQASTSPSFGSLQSSLQVSFNEKVAVRDIPSSKNFNNLSKARMYYSMGDFAWFRSERRRLLEEWDDLCRQGLCRTEDYPLGLEAEDEGRMRQNVKDDSIQTVLVEQFDQQDEGFEDCELLADLYFDCAHPNQWLAQDRADRLAREVQAYYAPRTCTRKQEAITLSPGRPAQRERRTAKVLSPPRAVSAFVGSGVVTNSKGLAVPTTTGIDESPRLPQRSRSMRSLQQHMLSVTQGPALDEGTTATPEDLISQALHMVTIDDTTSQD